MLDWGVGDHLYSSDRPLTGVDLALSVVASTILKSPDHCHKIDFITDNCAYFLYIVFDVSMWWSDLLGNSINAIRLKVTSEINGKRIHACRQPIV